MNLFLFGLLMGAADLLPGISGGTIAYAVGIYERLLDSLRLSKKEHWIFLLTLGAGVVSALLTLPIFLGWILESELFFPVFLAFVMGCVLGAALICGRGVGIWNRRRIGLFLLGLAAAFALGFISRSEGEAPANGYLPLMGAVAGAVMLLPGVSGAFALHMMGGYLPALAACHQFSLALFKGQIDGQALQFLLLMGSGLLVGLLLCAQGLRRLLVRYRPATLALLTGLMVGGVQRLWPFSGIDGMLIAACALFLLGGLCLTAALMRAN